MAAAVLLAACGNGRADEAEAPAPSTSAPVGPSRVSEPAITSLTDSATCSDYLRATGPARENATRAALIVVRHAAGLEREPPGDVRERFEAEVGEACQDRRSAAMLDVMDLVVAEGGEAYVPRTPQGAAGTAR